MKLYFYLPYSNALGTNSNTLPNSAIPSQQEAIYQEARKAFFKAVEQKTIAANLKTIQDATRNNYQGLDIAATKQQLKKENASLSFADIHCPEDYINNTGVVVTDITESSVKKLNDFGYSIEKKPDGYVSITHFNESNLNTDDAYAFWNEMLINCIVIGQGTKQRFTLPDETMQLEKRKELPVEFKNKISTHQAPKAAITKKLTLEDYEARAAALQATALSAKISSIQEDYEAQAEALLAAPLSSSDKNEDAQKKPKPMKPASRNPHNFVARHTFDTASDLVIPPETPTTPTILLGSGLIDKLKRSSRPPSTTTPKPAATTAKIQSTLPAIDKDKSLLIQRIKDLNLVNNLNESLKDAGKRLVTLLLYHPTELTLNDFLNHDTTMLREDIEELIYCTKQLIITYIKNLPHLDPEKSFFLNAILDYRPESRMTQTNAFSALFRISTPNGKDSFTELTNERTAMKEAIAREQAENRRKAKIREEADEIKRDQKIQQFLMEQQQQNQNSQKPLSATPQPPVKTSILNSLQKIKPEDTDAGEKLLSELHECQQHFTIEEMLLNDALTKTKQKKLVEHMINNMTDEMAELIADILDRSGKHPTLEQVIWQDFSFFSSTEIKKPEAGKGFPRGSSLAMLSDALEKHRDKYRATAATTNNQQANNAATANNSPVNIDDFFKSLSKLKSGEEIFNAMHEVTKTTHTLPEILAAIKKYLTDKQQTSVAMYIITKLQQNDSEIAKIAENIMELDPLLPILGPFMWYEFSNNPFD
ncbi:MAG TPA: hypothetical protein VHZ76_09805, partial [Gammaproteobacteria bacterium]|nr:hypothetical protein [Gammaproteobacteria bacterium]